jgi:ribosomal-protein-alanine N-acetyltransferase
MAQIQLLSPEAAQWPVHDYLGHHVWVACRGASIAGFIVIQEIPGGEWEVLNLAVRPEERRLGIGMRLLSLLPPGVTYLEVRSSNDRAIRLYARAGFRAIGRRISYYHSPLEDAVVMQLQK